MRRIIKESWRKTLPEIQRNNGTEEVLDSHASRMGQMLNNYDYEAICMQNVIANTKHMNMGELKAYLSTIERLAAGYQQRVGDELANVIIIGITTKAKDLQIAQRYYQTLVSGVERVLSRSVAASEQEAKSLRTFSAILYSKETSIFRFFKKGEIGLLRSVVATKRRRITKLSRRIERYARVSHRAKRG